MGPATQFRDALPKLQKALAAMHKDERYHALMTTGNQAAGFPPKPLKDWLADTVRELESQQGQLKNLSNAPIQQAQVVGNPTAPGGYAQGAPGNPGGAPNPGPAVVKGHGAP